MPATGLNPRIYHFTHVRNLEAIWTDGRVISDTGMRANGGIPVECADLNIKAERRTRLLSVTPGGVPADYVPFYFATRSPMLYVIAKGSVATYSEGQDNLVYLVSSVRRAIESGKPCVFSDGNCAAALTRHYADLALLPTVVDWEVMTAERWANTSDDGDRMRRRMAEFLVHEELPTTCVTHLATRTVSTAKLVSQLTRSIGPVVPVLVRGRWHY